MDRIRFVLDEHVPEYLADEIIRLEPAIDVLLLGDEGAPPKRLKDPELLIRLEELELALVTQDKKSMPGHLRNHWHAGRHTWGVIMMRQGHSVRRYAEEIVKCWTSIPREEWRDYSAFIP
jgi:hypothetical protein